MTTISLARENLELEKRRRLSEQGREHFYPFFKAAWPDIDQQSPYSDNWHIEAICEHLEALYRRQIHRLVISIPPGHTKSTLSSVAFEAWVWTQSPEEKFFTTSYDKALAIRDTQRTRELINSAWYQQYYGDLFSWADDQNVKCLSGETTIATNKGEIAIKTLVEGRLSVKVLTFNHDTGAREYKSILAYEKQPGKQSVRVTCANGATFICTTNHPIYVEGKGYIEAEHVQQGDTVYADMRSMPKTLRNSQSGKTLSSTCMQSRMSKKVATQRNRGATRVSLLPKIYSSQGKRRSENNHAPVLQLAMQSGMEQRAPRQQKNSSHMRAMRKRIFHVSLAKQVKILFNGLLLCSTSLEDAWAGAFAVREGLHNNLKADTRARWGQMSSLSQRGNFRGASYRPQQVQQQREQFNHTLPEVPQQRNATPASKRDVEATTITSVIPTLSPSFVYNLEIADNHNYFANGVLTHNSYYKNTKGGYRLASSVAGGATGQRANIVTVDDPHNVMDAIKSIIEREAALHWWDAAMSSRINDQQNDCFLIIGQRVHPQDLIGHVLETGLYEYLRLPAEFEPTKKTFTSIGWSDPRTEEGEPLWKQKFPKEVLDRLKMILKNEYYAQYQQSPNEDATSIIKSHWLLRFEETATHYLLHGKNGDRKVAKNKCQIVISNDLALSKNDQGCYVVFCTWALTPTYDLILLSVIREKFDAPETYEQIDQLWETYPRMMAFILEAVGYQSAVIQFSQQKGIPVIPYTPTIDKIARAKNISVYFANGQFFFPHFASWLAEYEKEITEFPGTKYKDQMDATSIVQALFEFGKPTVKDLSYDIAMDIVKEQFEKGNREAAEVMALKQLEKENGELARWLLEQN